MYVQQQAAPIFLNNAGCRQESNLERGAHRRVLLVLQVSSRLSSLQSNSARSRAAQNHGVSVSARTSASAGNDAASACRCSGAYLPAAHNCMMSA